MKPMPRLVARLKGRVAASGSKLLNRISEKIGAKAAPKKAVLIWAAKGSPRITRVEPDTGRDGPGVEKVLAEKSEAEGQAQASDGGAGHLGAAASVDGAKQQRQQPGIDEGRPHAADADVIGDQCIAVEQDFWQPARDLGPGRDQQAKDHEGARIGRKKPQPLRSKQQAARLWRRYLR